MYQALLFFVTLFVISSWIISIYIFRWTLQAAKEKQEKVKKIIRLVVFYSGVIWWMGRPEKEKDPEERIKRMKKYQDQIRALVFELIILAIVLISLGILAAADGLYDITFVNIVILAPIVGLYSFYLFLLWHLLKVDDGTSQLS